MLGVRQVVPRVVLGGILKSGIGSLSLPGMPETHGKIRHQGYNIT
jgi:hypothetical protein